MSCLERQADNWPFRPSFAITAKVISNAVSADNTNRTERDDTDDRITEIEKCFLVSAFMEWSVRWVAAAAAAWSPIAKGE